MEQIGIAEKLILIFMRKTKLTIKWIAKTIENVLKVIFGQKNHLKIRPNLSRTQTEVKKK